MFDKIFEISISELFKGEIHLWLLKIAILLFIWILILFILKLLWEYTGMPFLQRFVWDKKPKTSNIDPKTIVRLKKEILEKNSWWEKELNDIDKYISQNRACFLTIKWEKKSWKSWLMSILKEFLPKFYSFKIYELWDNDFRWIWSILLNLTEDIALRNKIEIFAKEEDISAMPKKEWELVDELSPWCVIESESDRIKKENILKQVIDSNEQNILVFINNFDKAPTKIKEQLLEFYKGVYGKIINSSEKRVVFILTSETSISSYISENNFDIHPKSINVLPLDINKNLEEIIDIINGSEINCDCDYEKMYLKTSLESISNDEWLIYIWELRNAIRNFKENDNNDELNLFNFILYLVKQAKNNKKVSLYIKKQILEIESNNDFNEWVRYFKNIEIEVDNIIKGWRNMFLKSRYENLFERCEYLIILWRDKNKDVKDKTTHDFFESIILIHEWEIYHQKSRFLQHVLKRIGEKNETIRIKNEIKKYLNSSLESYSKAKNILESEKMNKIWMIKDVFKAYTLNNYLIVKVELGDSSEELNYKMINDIFPQELEHEFINIYWLIRWNALTDEIHKSNGYWINDKILKELCSLRKDVSSTWLKMNLSEQIIHFHLKKWTIEEIKKSFFEYINFFKEFPGLCSFEQLDDIHKIYGVIKNYHVKFSKKQLERFREEISKLNIPEEKWNQWAIPNNIL